MQYLFLSILSIPFLYINYKIILNDLKEKKIPNKLLKYLLYLLPFYYIYIYFYINDISFIALLLQTTLTLIVSFVLYYFGIWSAGDAKYLLVLSLFIPNVGIVNFIGNIALLTILYLIIYFIWFYFGKCLFNWEYSKNLYVNIKEDLKEKTKTFLKFGDGNFYINKIIIKVINFLITFLIMFVGIRISRIYLLKDFDNIDSLKYLFDNKIYLLVLSILIIFLGILLLKVIYVWIKKISINKIYYKYIDIIGLSLLLLFLGSFIYYEYKIDSKFLIINLNKIFTIYLMLYIIFNIIRYSYSIAFQIAESHIIDINDIKSGDIIDKNYLLGIFKFYIPGNIDSNNMSIDNIRYINEINGFLDDDNVNQIKKRISNLNELHKNQKNFNSFTRIKILKTFSFGIYIFIGFIASYTLGSFIFNTIFNYFLNFIKNGGLAQV